MISYRFLKDNGIIVRTIKKLGKCFFVETINGDRYILKKDDFVNYKYLFSRNFHYFPENYVLGDYRVFKYYDDFSSSLEEKLNDIFEIVSILHLKTTRYVNKSLDEFKEIYEEYYNKISLIRDYYASINDLIDNEVYMSPSFYYLARNISIIYSATSFCYKELDKWYDIVKKNKRQREVYLHNNLSDSHLIRGDKLFLISWDMSCVGVPVLDLFKLYEKYNEHSFDKCLELYLKKFPLREEEFILFFIMISIPKKIEFGLDEFDNIRKLKNIINYLERSSSFIHSFKKK